MGLWKRLRAAFRRERRELDDVVKDATDRADRALTDRERELDATPDEKLRIEQERTAKSDAEFDELRRKIEGDRPA